MNPEYEIKRLKEEVRNTTAALRDHHKRLRNLECTNNLEGPPRTPEEMAQNARELDAVAPTPADKFALMFGMSERDALLDRFANALAVCLTTYPDLRVESVHDPLFDQWKKLRKIS